MADEKKPCCGHSRKFAIIGVLAIAYGVILYMRDVMAWQPYMTWLVVGVVFLLVGWVKNR